MEAIFSAAVVSMMLAAISHWLLLRKVKESQWFLAQRSIEHIEDQGKRTWDNCAQLWERNAEDRKLIGELRERVEELESSTNTTLHCPEVVDIFTTCLVPDTDWAADKPTEY